MCIPIERVQCKMLLCGEFEWPEEKNEIKQTNDTNKILLLWVTQS